MKAVAVFGGGIFVGDIRTMRVLGGSAWMGAVALLACAGTARAAAPLMGPWDAKPVMASAAVYRCAEPVVLPHDVVAYDFYSDDKHSVIDETRKAAYDAAAALFSRVSEETEKAADSYRATGSAAAAACAARWLGAQAKADAMTGTMSSNQANYVQNWTLGGLAIAYLKVRGAGNDAMGVTAEQRAAIEAWMQHVGREVEDYFAARREKGTKDGRNNHLYWAGLAAMAAGIAANDRGLYEWGAGTYRDGVDLIADDGTLPLEMDRGQRALHYHLFACAPLVTMAALAEPNGTDLFGYAHGRLRLLVTRSMAGLVNNSYFTDKAGAKQDTPEGGKVKPYDVEWLGPYLRHFPDGQIAKLMGDAGVKPYGYLGGLPAR